MVCIFKSEIHIIILYVTAFHEGKDETDPTRLTSMWSQARQGLVEIQKFTQADPNVAVSKIDVGW